MRCTEPPEPLLEALAIERRAAQIQVGGAPVWIATQDAGLYRDALGVAVPPGLPAAFLDTVNGPIDELARRFARNRGPFDLGTLSRMVLAPLCMPDVHGQCGNMPVFPLPKNPTRFIEKTWQPDKPGFLLHLIWQRIAVMTQIIRVSLVMSAKPGSRSIPSQI